MKAKRKRIVSIVVMSVVLVFFLVIFIKQDMENRIIKSNIEDFTAFNVHSDSNGNPVTFVPYGVEILGDTEGLNVIVVDTGNPTLIIDVDNNISIGKGDSGTAVLNVLNGSSREYIGLYSGACEVEGMNKPIMIGDKISYEIKLPIETGLLDMAPEKEWILLSLENDKSLMRTYLGYHLSKSLGMAYTPDFRYVELFINGDYRGTYMLTEKIEIAPNRLNIDKLNPDIISGEGITGGYLMQIDLSTKKKDEMTTPTGKNFYFTANNPNILPGAGERSQILVKQSKKLLKVHFDYIKDYIKQAEDVLFSDRFKHDTNGFRRYFDQESFIDWYIIEEIFKNPDVTYLTGPYFYKERYSNIKMGPVSNFDFGAGSSYYLEAKSTDGWYVRNTAWYKRMFEDDAFNNEFKTQWKYAKDNILVDLPNVINDMAANLKVSARFNATRWNLTEDNSIVFRESEDLDKEYINEVDELRKWLEDRIAWIDSNI